MKFLHVIGSMNPHTGGPGQAIRNLAPWFAEQGSTMEVVCLDDPNSSYLSQDKFQIHALGEGRGAWNYHPGLLPWFEKNLPRFDAVFLNGLWLYPGYALSKATRRGRAPSYFIFPHGMLDPWFQKLSVRPLKAVRNWIFWKLIEKRVVNQAAALLFTCEEERRLARLPFRSYLPQKEAVVGLGVPEPPEYTAQMKAAFAEKCPAQNARPYFLFLGRIHPKKGVDLLLKAYAALFTSGAGQDQSAYPILIVAGPGGETDYGRAMQKLAAEICPPHSVFWPGMLAGDAKWGALYHCDAFVLPSHQENFGIAVVEALACGRPVLISNQVNIWREIQEAGAALVETDTVAGTTRMFHHWLSLSAEAKSRLATQARPCFQRFFSGQAAASNLLQAVSAAVNS